MEQTSLHGAGFSPAVLEVRLRTAARWSICLVDVDLGIDFWLTEAGRKPKAKLVGGGALMLAYVYV